MIEDLLPGHLLWFGWLFHHRLAISSNSFENVDIPESFSHCPSQSYSCNQYLHQDHPLKLLSSPSYQYILRHLNHNQKNHLNLGLMPIQKSRDLLDVAVINSINFMDFRHHDCLPSVTLIVSFSVSFFSPKPFFILVFWAPLTRLWSRKKLLHLHISETFC